MKALKEMNNVEKAHLLAKLFPEAIKELALFVGEECERFKKHEKYMRSIWADKTLITANFWYGLVDNTERILKRHKVMLHKNPRVFSDQLFDGYNGIFLTNSLVEFTEREECTAKLKEAIHLLFGTKKIILITSGK